MLDQQTYIRRRAQLKKEVGQSIIILFGSNESPASGPLNGYHPFRQDLSFLYYFEQNRDGLVGVINIDNGIETLIGDDVDTEDIVWFGSVDSIKDTAEQVGMNSSAPMKYLKTPYNAAIGSKRKIHFLPSHHRDVKLQIYDLLGTHPSQQKESVSLDLVKAVIEICSAKGSQGIEELERATKIDYLMHTAAMRLIKPGVTEKSVGGQVGGIVNSYGAMVSFSTTFSQHGEIIYDNPSLAKPEAGRLVPCDTGAEAVNNYCSNNTRTFPVDGKYIQRQLEIYSIIEVCHGYALEVTKPGMKYIDVYFFVYELMTERLKELGLMKGDTEETARAGAHVMFLPHGLGHMISMDVHDMEALGQTYMGFDDKARPSLEQFGTNALHMGHRLKEGFVVADEPGIYFVPVLVGEWKVSGHCVEFLNFDKLETYEDLGGVRIESDILITEDGCHFLGRDRIPYHPKDAGAFMANNSTK